MEKTCIDTPLGLLQIEGDASGIAAIRFVENTSEVHSSVPNVLEAAVEQLTEYFEDSRTEFNLALNPKGTDFQKKVWQKLLQIPFGNRLGNHLGRLGFGLRSTLTRFRFQKCSLSFAFRFQNLTLFITFFTVSFQTFKAASLDPQKALRDE